MKKITRTIKSTTALVTYADGYNETFTFDTGTLPGRLTDTEVIATINATNKTPGVVAVRAGDVHYNEDLYAITIEDFLAKATKINA